jgi:hypothetical protein
VFSALSPDDEAEQSIDSMQIDGVWADGDSLDAAHGGTVGIQNGCLAVDDAVIVSRW